MNNAGYKLILIGLLIFAFTACDDNSDDSENPNSNPSSSSETIQSSNWEIANYEDDNETYHFSGYSFDFSDNGEASATNGTSTISGT